MGRLLRRAWRYLVAVLSGKLDQVSDPKVQIEQAIEEARQQHALLSQQAAAVIGNERELQLKLTRAVEETEKPRPTPVRPCSWPSRRATPATRPRPPPTRTPRARSPP